MKHFLCSTSLIFCLMTFQLLGCSENVEIGIAEEVDDTAVEILTPEPIATIRTPIIFEQLQNEFAGRLENQGNFIALRNITTSQTYLDFLEEAYPTEKRVETLEEYFQIAPPDTERYTSFLEQWTDNPTEEDISVMHRITTIYREANLLLFDAANIPKPQAVLNLGLLFEKKIGVMTEPPTKELINRHQIPLDEFADTVDEFATETEKMDAVWLHEQLEAHGTDLGLLWSAIHNPALIGEVLQNFSSTDHFLKWVDVTKMKENDA